MTLLDWQVLDSKYILQDTWLAVRADTCRLPDGQISSPWYVLEYRPWVAVVALTPESEVVLVRQYRHGIGRVILEFPGGVVEQGDSPAEAARRELMEETGYSASNFVEIGRISPNPASHNNTTYCFLAGDAVRTSTPHLDETEYIEAVTLPLDELIGLVRAGEFVHSLHISALFFALDRLGRIR